MKHLQEFKVGFIGSVARSFDGNKYYQNVFLLEGKTYQAKAAEDYAGKAGIVQFLKKDEIVGDKKITQDCFTLKMITTASNITAAKAACAELAALED
jgi:hypothetical protein